MGFAWVLADAQEAVLFEASAYSVYLPRHRKPPRAARAWQAALALFGAVGARRLGARPYAGARAARPAS